MILLKNNNTLTNKTTKNNGINYLNIYWAAVVHLPVLCCGDVCGVREKGNWPYINFKNLYFMGKYFENIFRGQDVSSYKERCSWVFLL